MTTNRTESNGDGVARWTRKDWLLLAVNAVIFVVMYALFDHRLPDVVGSHYNVQGEQDDTMQKWSMWLLYAGIGIALPAVLSFVRRIDPRKQNYAHFEGYFDLMRWAVSLLLHGVFLLMILQNLGHELPFIKLIAGGIGLLWIVIGNRMGQLRSNFFVGIKTPWALTDDDNWRKTHRMGARLWVAAGLIIFVFAFLLPSVALAVALIACTMLSAFVPMLYSYLLFKRKNDSPR